MASKCAVPSSMGYDEFLSRASCEVIVCHSDRDFDGFMSMASGKPGSDVVVVDFYAEWCGDCRQMDPFLQDWVKKLPGVIFLKVNIEKAKEATTRWRVESTPTFVLLKQGNPVATLLGANKKEELLSKIVEHMPPKGR
uniref:Thioredoxin H-type n=1 Tax=Anthurium amnicola TaxID=1678845 RepID=A0A1D1YS14_9ARAE